MPRVFLVPEEVRRGQIRWSWIAMQVLGIDLRSSRSSVSAFEDSDISLHLFLLLETLFSENLLAFWSCVLEKGSMGFTVLVLHWLVGR